MHTHVHKMKPHSTEVTIIPTVNYGRQFCSVSRSSRLNTSTAAGAAHSSRRTWERNSVYPRSDRSQNRLTWRCVWFIIYTPAERHHAKLAPQLHNRPSFNATCTNTAVTFSLITQSFLPVTAHLSRLSLSNYTILLRKILLGFKAA